MVASLGLTAEVSMVMVGALCRLGPGEGVLRAVSLSAMVAALVTLWLGPRIGGLYGRR